MGMAVVVALLTAWQYWFAGFKVRTLIGVDTAVLTLRRRHTAASDANADETKDDREA